MHIYIYISINDNSYVYIYIYIIYIYIYTHVIQCTHTYTDPKWMVSDPMTGNVAHSYLTTSMASPF